MEGRCGGGVWVWATYLSLDTHAQTFKLSVCRGKIFVVPYICSAVFACHIFFTSLSMIIAWVLLHDFHLSCLAFTSSSLVRPLWNRQRTLIFFLTPGLLTPHLPFFVVVGGGGSGTRMPIFMKLATAAAVTWTASTWAKLVDCICFKRHTLKNLFSPLPFLFFFFVFIFFLSNLISVSCRSFPTNTQAKALYRL